MRAVAVVLVTLSMISLSGCVAELFVIRTVEEIKRSEAHAEHASSKTPDLVTSCMMQTLYGFTNKEGKRPYAEVSSQTFGTTQTITLRTGKNMANQMYGGGDELLFLIENSVQGGGTKSDMWSNQNYLSPSPKEYLKLLSDVVKTCL
jgi:hypothetical protein